MSSIKCTHSDLLCSVELHDYRSLLSRYALNPFWTWFVTLWPLNVAPNTVRRNVSIIVAALAHRSLSDHTHRSIDRLLKLLHAHILRSVLPHRERRLPRPRATAMDLLYMGFQFACLSDFGCHRWVRVLSNSTIYNTYCFDSKQARRTGMAGPLGELFDHGACSAVMRHPVGSQVSFLVIDRM